MRNPALTPVLALACLTGLTLTACDSEVASPPATSPADTADAHAAADATVDADAPPAPDTDPAVDAAARSFICDNGHWVELVGADTARVTLADGRTIEIPRKPGGAAEYRGEALSFDLAADGQTGVLGQDEVGGFDCNITG